jgi:hypothetical protein
MRDAFFEKGWLELEGGGVYGVALGYDRCAQHEEGADDIFRQFKVPGTSKLSGIEARQATVVPASLVFTRMSIAVRKGPRKYPAAVLYLPESGSEERSPQSLGPVLQVKALPLNKPNYDLMVGWSRNGFLVAVRGEQNVQWLEEVYQAATRNDLALDVGRRGLSLVIVSKLPDEAKAALLDADLGEKELLAAAAATGIEKTLKDAGKGWYALSPRWKDEKQKEEVIFFLNPMEQSKNRCGWFSVQELEQWARNTGPVVKRSWVEAFAAAHAAQVPQLISSLEKRGVSLRAIPRFDVLNESLQKVGLTLQPHGVNPLGLMEGTYSLEALEHAIADIPLETDAYAG